MRIHQNGFIFRTGWGKTNPKIHQGKWYLQYQDRIAHPPVNSHKRLAKIPQGFQITQIKMLKQFQVTCAVTLKQIQVTPLELL